MRNKRGFFLAEETMKIILAFSAAMILELFILSLLLGKLFFSEHEIEDSYEKD